MLQRGLLTNAEQQQPTPYDTTTRAHRCGTTSAEANLHRDEEGQEFNNELQQQEQKERINCLPIIEMPQIKIEQDMEDYMEEEEEVSNNNREDKEMLMQQQQQELEEQLEQEHRDEGQGYEPMDIGEQQQQPDRGGGIKPITQLLEPTSILKTSLLTGAANTLATLTAAAEQIARMPNETLNKNYPYFKEENRRTYTTTIEDDTSSKHNDNLEQASEKNKDEEMEGITTYTSILQTALMAKRPANNDNALATATGTATATSVTKTLQNVRTPDQVLKTAVTLATLSEIAAQQEQQQLQQQQQQQQQQQKQMPHILIVPQVAVAATPPMRKMCTLPFKKLNFANVTTTTSTTPSSSTISSPLMYTTTTKAATTSPNTASSTNTTTNTTTIITNNNYTLGSNIKANTNLINKNATTTTTTKTKTTNIISTKQQAASYNNNSNLNSIISNNNNNGNNNGNSNCNSNTMATQTLKIPQPHIQHIKPHLVTSETQTEDTTVILPSIGNNNNSSSNTSLKRTAVSVQTKQLIQTTSTSSLSTSSLSTSSLSSASTSTTTASALTVTMANVKPVNTDNNNKTGHIFKHNSQNATVSGSTAGGSVSGCSKDTNTLTKMNIIKTIKPSCKDEHNHTVAMSTAAASHTSSSSSSTPPATNVTVVVFETLLPED